MASQDEQHLLGRFWLAGSPKRVLPGWLDLSGSNPTITLAGQMTAPVEMVQVAEHAAAGSPPSEFTSDRFTIHGLLSSGLRPKVTLLEARAYPRNFQAFGDLGPGSENGTQVFEGYWLIHGTHVHPDEPILKARVRFTYIDEWIGRSGIVRANVGIGENKTVELLYQAPPPQEAEIPDGLGSIRVSYHRDLTRPTAAAGIFDTKHHCGSTHKRRRSILYLTNLLRQCSTWRP
jgi:ApeA-like protein